MTRAASFLIAVLVLAVAAVPAAAAPKKSTKSPGDIASYWTDERMKDAKPRDRARPGGAGGGGKTTDWYRYAVTAPYEAQTALNGKLFFTLDGSRYVCSATAVQATSVNLIWTAGHCITDGIGADGKEHAATEVLFIPGYHNGAEPYGRWAATSTDSTPGWEDSGGEDFRFDVGAAQVTKVIRNSSGQWVPTSGNFTTALGAAPRSVEFGALPIGTKVVSYGYPAAGKFNGQLQYACASSFRKTDTWNSLPPAPMQIGCDMTGGSSGGGWVRDTDLDGAADEGEPLVSVNSYGYGFEKNTMYGPQMPDNGQAEALYTRMGGA